MEKFNVRTRIIKFSSLKNQCIIKTHSRDARLYAEFLEKEKSIWKYESLVKLDIEKYKHISSVGIRKSYFENEWTSDFVITNEDGTISIRELAKSGDLDKRAAIERLEFSRRYWVQTNIKDWKIVIMGGQEDVL